MKLAKLNDAGLKEFSEYLTKLHESPGAPVPSTMLTDPRYSAEFEKDIDVQSGNFKSRYELGQHLVERLAPCDQTRLAADTGLWSWLALLYFDELCPADASGNRKPSRRDNYILGVRQQDYHRHAIRTTYMLVREHGELVRYMLSSPLSKRGELTEQLTGRSYFLSCRGIMEAAHILYADPDRNIWKRGAASKKPGAVRRFGLVVRQFELTYDVFSLDGEQIVSLLPKEFNQFRDVAI